MARYSFGGAPWDVVVDVTGAVCPDWPVSVFDPDDTENALVDVVEDGTETLIPQLRTNDAESTTPGLIRTFNGPDELKAVVYIFTGPDGRPHRWYEPAHEISLSLATASQAASDAAQALTEAQSARDTATNAHSSAEAALASASNGAIVAQQSREAADAYISSVTPSASVDALVPPVYVAHRGGRNLAPENTLEALDACLSLRLPAVHFDARRTLDGAMFCVNWDNVGGYTTLFDEPWKQTAPGVARGRVRAGQWFCNTWPDTLRIPLLSQVLARAHRRTVVFIQVDGDQWDVWAATDLITRLKAESFTVLMSSNRTELRDTAAPVGVNCCWVDSDPASTDHASVLADGIEFYAVDVAASSTDLDDALAAGLKLLVVGVDRHVNRDVMPADVFGLVTAEPLYVDPNRDHRSFVGPHGSGSFYHGHLPLLDAYAVPDSANSNPRGIFIDTGSTYDLEHKTNTSASATHPAYASEFHSLLAGWICPLEDPNDWGLDGEFYFDNWDGSTAWVGFFMCSPTDRVYDNNNLTADDRGYFSVFYPNSGNIEVIRIDGTSFTTVASASTTSPVAGGTRSFQVVVTDTQVTLTVNGVSAAATDATYRGEYAHYIGRGTDVRYRGMEVL